MKGFRVSLFLIAGGALLVGGAPSTARSGSDPSATARQELAAARNATAKYHDVDQASADGYVNEGYVPGEGFEYLKENLIDCTFDLEQPEALHYIPSGQGLRLVGVEYVIPIDCTATEPEGFSGDADEWEFEAEGFPIWALQAWLWVGNPNNGVFADPPHPQIP